MKNKEIKTARLLITRLAVQVRLGEPKESKPLREIVKAFFVFVFSLLPVAAEPSNTALMEFRIFLRTPYIQLLQTPPSKFHRHAMAALPDYQRRALATSMPADCRAEKYTYLIFSARSGLSKKKTAAACRTAVTGSMQAFFAANAH